eukprot:NODE_13488_length_1162_cov_28.178744.p1 GENE.NODE_13488_length_1162_cov_28.178744~~NODE_13488_length_1162_cov_28.178744.p1  ORF type:complete len:273 (-),score=38.34 NODE_13488_length_1162_cov_28.178744:225-1043(-)
MVDVEKQLREPMVTDDDAKYSNRCWNCGNWVKWRGSRENRTSWKVVCTFLFLVEFAGYFDMVLDSIALLFMGGVTFVKIVVEIWGQDTPTWVCPGTWLLFIVIFFLGYPTIVSCYGYCRKAVDYDFPGRDWIAVALFLFGSCYSLSYEVHRFQWKAKPENKGKLHTTGLAAYCIHPNYFGDLFTYTGWGLATGTYYGLSPSVMMIWSFAVFIMPNSDAYLAQRYPEEFPAYAEKTATLIPFLRSKCALHTIGWVVLAASLYLEYIGSAACGA